MNLNKTKTSLGDFPAFASPRCRTLAGDPRVYPYTYQLLLACMESSYIVLDIQSIHRYEYYDRFCEGRQKLGATIHRFVFYLVMAPRLILQVTNTSGTNKK